MTRIKNSSKVRSNTAKPGKRAFSSNRKRSDNVETGLLFESLEQRRLLAVDLASFGDPGITSATPSGGSGAEAISADGRYVVFESGAANLVPGDDNNAIDIFRYDRVTGNIDLVSINSDGTGSGNGDSDNPVVSADGTVVAFESHATDLDPRDTNSRMDVFSIDLSVPGATPQLVSINSVGTASGNHTSENPAISADGTVVAFQSIATDLDLLDSNGNASDVFSLDLSVAGATPQLVSVTRSGAGGGNEGSENPAISADGRFVAFESLSTNLHPLDTDLYWDVYSRDLSITGPFIRLELVSINSTHSGSITNDSFDSVISQGNRTSN